MVFECGAIVNPDGLRNQIEGGVVQGLGGALFMCVAPAIGSAVRGLGQVADALPVSLVT